MKIDPGKNQFGKPVISDEFFYQESEIPTELKGDVTEDVEDGGMDLDSLHKTHGKAHGAHGIHGAHGAHGTHGAQGAQDTHGTHGAHGIHGAQGAHGTHGAQGAHGAQDTHGAQGGHGTHGAQDTHGKALLERGHTLEHAPEHGMLDPAKFATAMLAGMGYQPKTKDEEEEEIKRPKRLGLGAEDLKRKRGNLEEYLLTENTQENAKTQENHLCEIVGGCYAGLFARILQVMDDCVIVRLNLKNRLEVQIPNNFVSAIDIRKYPLLHPVRVFARNENADDDKSNKRTKKSQEKTIKKKKKKIKWLLPNLHVRMISKSFKKGMYYKEKAKIIDIPSIHHCIIQFDSDGTIHDSVSEYDLETVLPKAGNKVMIVRGSNRGKIATLLEKKKKASVLLESEVLELTLNDVCAIV